MKFPVATKAAKILTVAADFTQKHQIDCHCDTAKPYPVHSLDTQVHSVRGFPYTSHTAPSVPWSLGKQLLLVNKRTRASK